MQIFKQGKKIFDVNERKCPLLPIISSITWSFSTMLQLQKNKYQNN
jgi:hypothetical protein